VIVTARAVVTLVLRLYRYKVTLVENSNNGLVRSEPAELVTIKAKSAKVDGWMHSSGNSDQLDSGSEIEKSMIKVSDSSHVN